MNIILLYINLICIWFFKVTFSSYELYFNIFKPGLITQKFSSFSLDGYFNNKIYDGSVSSWRSEVSFENPYVGCSFLREVRIDKIRFFKLHDKYEKINVKFASTLIQTIEPTLGWNEYAILSNNVTKNLNLTYDLNASNISFFEVGELQIFIKEKVYASCEDYFQSNGQNGKIYLYNTLNIKLSNVAGEEYGAKCESSSGKCSSVFKDEIFLFDEMWIPGLENKPYLKIEFFKKYLLKKIIIIQSINNTIQSFELLYERSGQKFMFNNNSLETEVIVNILTSWLEFTVNRLEGKFLGLSKIKVLSYSPQVTGATFCMKDGNTILTTYKSFYKEWIRNHQPTSTAFCSSKIDYYKG